MKKEDNYVKWFSELSKNDISIAGGKGASLAEMYNNKFPIPPGFVITSFAYSEFIKKAEIDKKIERILRSINIEDTNELNEASDKIRKEIELAKMPKEIEEEILDAYEILDDSKINIPEITYNARSILKNARELPFVAVRSSATTEDLENASFAGQQETFLNVKGKSDLIDKTKKCFSSLFTPRAIYYRVKKGFAPETSLLAVVVQKMIDSEKSGVMFSKNPVNNNGAVVIEAVWGLGEGIVSGRIKPDHYEVIKENDFLKIEKIEIAEKKVAIVRNSAGETKEIKLTESKSKQQVLTENETKRLAFYALQLEKHYNKPQDIEFAISNKEIFIVQSRPITTKVKEDKIELKGKVLLIGQGASPGVASGIVKIVRSMKDLNSIKEGDILVTEMTNPDMVVAMEKASAIITDEGGITSHAAIVSREMGIPCIVGTGEATKKLKDGIIVSVDGYSGRVFEGKIDTKPVEIKPLIETKTKIKVIVDLPQAVERAKLTKAKGVGLVRLEEVIASNGKHPLFFEKNDKLEDYTKLLTDFLEKIASPFEEIWIRTSDIRTDEFRNLEDAPKEIEDNPMLGNHGIRFSLKHPEIFKAEIKAVRNLSLKFSEKKFGIMMPQIIDAEEIIKAKKLINEVKIPSNVKIGVMIETPSAVQCIKEICETGISFISFGTNDLTQYTLAIDRNNPQVQYLFNEMHPSVLKSIKQVIETCKRYNVETSICGQAANREEMVRFLFLNEIDSISVNADSANKVSELVSQLEKSTPLIIRKEIRTERKNEAEMNVASLNSLFSNFNFLNEKEGAIISVKENTIKKDKEIENPTISMTEDKFLDIF